MKNQCPSTGLKILERLYTNHPNHQGITNSLINAYIRFGEHDKAINMISQIPNGKTDVASLKFKAWVEHKNENIDKEKEIWRDILEKSFYIGYEGTLGDIIQRDNKKINITSNDIPLFCVERNEILRLPFFLEYYRKLGVTKFFFVDNNSNDGSFEFLLEQSDCYVFWTNSSYSKAGHGFAWIQFLINKYIKQNQWYILADADEFLVYPCCEEFKLPFLLKYLEQESVEAVSCFVLDMFSINKNNTASNLLINSPYFVNDYKYSYQIECPYKSTTGGVRTKIFDYNPVNLTTMLLFKHTSLFNIKLSSRHSVTPLKLSQLSSVALHFKFIDDFQKKYMKEIKRKEYSTAGVGCKPYIKENINFESIPKTTKYQNSQQLVDLGLIQCPDDWLEFIKNEKNDE